MAEIIDNLPRHTRSLGSIAIQAAIVVLIVGLVYWAALNAAQNLARAHIASGFGFWNNTAGFDISQTLIAYSPSTSTFGRAFWVGLLNTLVVAAIGIVLATVLGFIVGIARLSRNWLVARACRRLRRTDPQRAAPAATFVLVQRRAQIAAGIARQRDVAGRRGLSTIAACSCRGRNLAPNFERGTRSRC